MCGKPTTADSGESGTRDGDFLQDLRQRNCKPPAILELPLVGIHNSDAGGHSSAVIRRRMR